jgi:hypothetical protein
MAGAFCALFLAGGVAGQIGTVQSPPPAPPYAPPPASPCPNRLTVTTDANVNTFGEQFWVIDGSQYIESGFIASYTVTTMEVCLETGAHTIKLVDTYGDGWTEGSYVSIVETASGLPVLGEMTLASGYEVTYQFWVGPTPMHPPSPPRDPPGVIKHETCHLLIRGIRGPGYAMQIAEVGIFDPAGVPLPVLAATSDCEPVTWESSTQAVDGNEHTNWFCTPFAYGNGTVDCSDECIGYPSWGSDGYCDDGGPGAEYSGCEMGTDCTDCGPRGTGGPGATINIEFEGHHSIGSYYLMTANDYPERDPTNWTLSCVDRDGIRSVMSEVDGVVPPTERQMIYGQTYFIDSPPSPPPTSP